MDKNRKRSRRRLAAAAAGLLVLAGGSSLLVNGVGMDTTWDDVQTDAGDVTAPVEADRIRVGENTHFVLEYDRAGADVYITDKRSGKVWSNAIAPDYYTDEYTADTFATHLLSVSLADTEGSVSQTHLFNNEDGEFIIEEQVVAEENKLQLTIQPAYTDVTFRLDMWLDDTGFGYSLPEEAIQETGDYKITQITMLPGFGAALPGEDGYILYPDGSGALVRFEKSKQAVTLASYPLYGPDVQDLELLQENEEQNTYNMMLPVFGMSREDGGFLAAITEGAADTNLSIAQPGYQMETYRAYFTFVYRRFATLEIGEEQVVELMPTSNGGTRTVRYHLLEPKVWDYSAMANAYRQMLVEDGVLTKLPQRDNVPLALDLFMSATEKGFFAETDLKATTFAQAADILEDLNGKNVKDLQVTLLAWSQGGYDNMPTTLKASSALGGGSGMKALVKAAEKTGATLYWNVETLLANKGKGSFNDKKEVIRNHYGSIINYDGRYLLNPVKVLGRAVQSMLKKRNDGLANLQLASLGRYAIPDYMKNGYTGRQAVEKAYRDGMAALKKSSGTLAVEGGNAYVLPYADKLSGIPDTDSAYYISDGAVPFYQLVTHGYVDYTSVAGNQSYEFAQQKLRWVEYGCNPYFILTWENPILLKESSYNKLFTSEYAVWAERVVATAEEFSSRLGDVWGQEMVGHTTLADGVVRVTYADGSRTYINYTTKEVRVEGQTVPAEDYVVIKGEVD